MSNVWIWGIGNTGKFAIRYINENKTDSIKGIIDNSPMYEDFSYKNIKIVPFEKAKSEINGDLIVICMGRKNYEAVKKTLYENAFSNFIWIYEYLDFSTYTNHLFDCGHEEKYISKICDELDFAKENMDYFNTALKNNLVPADKPLIYHRKKWEWCYIASVLKEKGMLCDEKKAIAFAVGKEPLPALFANLGCSILATDLQGEDEAAKKWQKTGQNACSNVESLYFEHLCEKEVFLSKVFYRDVNMNYLPDDICNEGYDFCWSSCAIEHVGSLELSKDFLKNMIQCLKPGGIAIHTTEINLSSSEDTIEKGDSILWRQKDILEMKKWFEENGCKMECSFMRSDTEANNYIDMLPFEGEYLPYHMNLVISGYASTSFAFVIEKNR